MRRLGLRSGGPERDAALVSAWFGFLEETKSPFERAFFDWRGGISGERRAAASFSAPLYASPAFGRARKALEELEQDPGASLDHPYFAGAEPCTMLIEEVEALWAPIAEADDWGPLAAKLAAVAGMREAYQGDSL